MGENECMADCNQAEADSFLAIYGKAKKIENRENKRSVSMVAGEGIKYE
jgi:hypothetical protein